MNDLLGKAIRGLECCSTYDDYSRKSCRECPYNEPDGKRSCKLHQMRVDALTLLKAQGPRVMTLEEVKGMKRLTICAVEQRSKVIKTTFNAEYGGIVTLGNENFLDFGLYGDTNRYRRSEAGYGKTWRCWTSRPTDSERGNTPWEDCPVCSEAQREDETASDMRDYCERYEPTYNPEDGSM